MNDCYRINDAEIIHETIDGEVMLLNLTNGNYFSLDNIGVLIWEMISQNCPVDVLTEAITDIDPSDKEDMKGNIEKIIFQMLEEGLIVPFDENINLNRTAMIDSLKSRLQNGSIQYIVPFLHMYKDIQEKYAHPAGVKAI